MMGLFALEHSRAAYRADLALHAAAVLSLAALLCWGVPQARAPAMAAFVVLGLAAWTAIEYGLHRFVLHGLQPFSRWHAAHHERPAAWIYAPTVLVAALMFTLVFLPALAAGGIWRACALTLGVLAGYLAYAVIHHAMHHGRAQGAWLKQRRFHHARHHRRAARPVCYGVTSAFWDRAFGTF
jgi:sterol desaturase/sphingolipid hydroxylase (fatty acid hydroxylase superfamily)